MRITQSMMTRNFLTGLNRNINNVAKSNARMASGRRFEKVWEDTASATKAFTVRERLYKSEAFAETIEASHAELSASESNLRSMHSMISSVNDKVLHGVNAATSAEARETLAHEIGNMKEQVLQLANSKFGDKFLFGGSNNSTGAFTEVGGKLHFNGVDMDTITKDVDGKFVYPDPAGGGGMVPVPEVTERYLDIGLGMVMNGDSVNAKTAFQVSTSGLTSLGFGVDGEGDSKNLYNILSEIEKALTANPFDLKEIQDLSADMKATGDGMLMTITDIGSKTNFLDQMQDRFENDILNLKTEQKRLEQISIEEESIYNAEYNAAWMTSLKLGSQIIPPSLFDFMR